MEREHYTPAEITVFWLRKTSVILTALKKLLSAKADVTKAQKPLSLTAKKLFKCVNLLDQLMSEILLRTSLNTDPNRSHVSRSRNDQTGEVIIT